MRANPGWTEGWGLFEWACVIATSLFLGTILAATIAMAIVGPPSDPVS